jgi:hypothetical protein
MNVSLTPEQLMDEWTPVLALPNLDMRVTLECAQAAIVAPTDSRVERLCVAHPRLTTFLSKFCSQFREQVWPSIELEDVREGEPVCVIKPQPGRAGIGHHR